MKKQIVFLAILMLLCNSIFATTYTYTGTGNWNDVARWTPNFPTNVSYQDTILISGNCTIPLTDNVVYGLDTNYVDFYFIINDTLNCIGNIDITGDIIVNGTLLNYGSISISQSVAGTSAFVNNGFLLNNGNMNVYGEVGGNFYNNALIHNYGNIWAGAEFGNNGTINSYAGGFYVGPFLGITNNGTISGKATFQKMWNTESSVLSPGYGFVNTDTFTISMYYTSFGIVNIDINSTTDKDIIILEDAFTNSIDDSLGEIHVNFNPAFVPNVLDTFVLIQEIGMTNSLQFAKISTVLPQPPTGLVWLVKQEPNRIYITLDFALPIETPIVFNFYAQKLNNTSLLNYTIYKQDIDLDYFVVERSKKDIIHFVSIGTFKYDENNLAYHFIDENPMEGENVYRIVAYNNDGKINQYYLTNMCLVDFSPTEDIIVNTVVENDLIFNLAEEQFLSIVDMNGKIVYNQYLQAGKQTISLSHLSKGMYVVQTEKSNFKIIKK